MKKLYAVIIAISALSMGSQLIAGPFNPKPPAPAPAPVVPAPVPELPALDEEGALDLSDRGLGDAGIIAVAPHFPQDMKDLILDNNNIGPIGAEAIANNLFRAQDLNFITLRHNHIGVAGVRALVQNLPDGFVLLGLDDNNLGDAGALALAEHPLPRTLTVLSLDGNHIGNPGIIALAQHLQQNPIENFSTLYLRNNEFGDEGKQALINAGYHEGEGAGGIWRKVPAAEAGQGH